MNEEQLDVVIFGPELHELGRSFGTVVDPQVLGIAVDRGNVIEHVDD
ncbi:MAG TPA: hypothetical protein VMD47_01760 [Candidatus Acidoferrales bacterium]|nr:hypothetical protein [Candidatus Acidoferrales bacterium]